MDYKFSVERGYIHPDLISKCKKLASLCKENDIPIKFSEGYRTVREQNDLYAQGRTKPGSIVTNAMGSSYSSQHQWGIAADFYLDLDVDGDGDKKDDAFNNCTNLFDIVGQFALDCGLGWGGNWTRIVDKPHLYLPKWGSTTQDLKKQFYSPDIFMGTWGYSDKNSFHCKPVLIKPDYKELQKILGVKVDGVPGKITLAATPTLKFGSRGSVVTWVQKYLNYTGSKLVVDGIYGKLTEQEVMYYQKDRCLAVVDGIISGGKNTWRCILGLYHK